MALTQQDLELAYQYVMGKGMSIHGLEDGGGDLSKMYLAPILQYNTAGTQAKLVRLAVSYLQKPAVDAAAEAQKTMQTIVAALNEMKSAVQESITEAISAAATAEAATAEALKQAKYAKSEGDKASALTADVEYLMTNKADGMIVENSQLFLTSNGEPITEGIDIPSGSGTGGGGGGSILRLRNLTGSSLVCTPGQKMEVKYSFASVDSEDSSETGDGSATYYVNSIVVLTENITQGEITRNISKYLKKGNNAVRVTVQDSYGSSRSLNWKVEVADVSLASAFDDNLIYTSAIEFRYIPIGLHEKTIHFLVDGVELGTETTSVSNRELTYSIPSQTHGSHLLEVYATIEVLGVTVESNRLVYDILCVARDNNTPIIASGFNGTEVKQHTSLVIPFTVYNPASLKSEITLRINGSIAATQTVDRTRQAWNYRVKNTGNLLLEIVCGAVVKSFNLNVLPAEITVEPETRGLQLYLTAADRSNNDNNRSQWVYEDVSASLTGFNFKTDGWLVNNGSVALRVSGDARVTIPFRIFASDFRAFGKTIEFEFSTTGVSDYEAVLINCMSGSLGLQVTAQLAIFKSEQTTVDTRFKEDERVRVAFVVEKRSEHRLIYIYINGIFSGVAQYPAEDNFQQLQPVDIVIGSNDCTIDLYNIRIYDNNLTQHQLLDNYIGDIDDPEKKMELYLRNQVYNDYGDISYAAILEQLPCMIITGTLPTYKGDKKTVSISYTNLQEPEKSFASTGVQIDVQGTSSQYYPRKNFKTKHSQGFVVNGQQAAKYTLREDSIPVSVFCFKADFAESSGAHNTGLAKIIDRLLKALGLLTPPQKENNRIRTTVDGFPMAVFHKATEESDIVFIGKYNFNNDKSTNETFGFDAGDESWEFLNNTSDRSLFKTSDYSTDDWQNDFESRYPEGNTDYTNLKAVTDWITSTKDNPAKFKAEAVRHFDLQNLLAYYLLTEVFAMVDQRAKNMFLTSWGRENGSTDYIWRFIFYDNDTCFGINNEGLTAFNFNVEYHDRLGTQNVWNGEQSVLWNNLETSFQEEIETLYRTIRAGSHLSYQQVIAELNAEQSDRWCEAIYNADGRFKYVDPLIQSGNSSYLYAAQGSRAEHRKWWAYNRFLYMDSKYGAGDFLQDFATLRLYTPGEWAGVTPNANFTIVPFTDQYVRVKYGSYILGQRGHKDVPVGIQAPAIQFNDTETIVYGASRLKGLGDLAGMYAGSVDVSMATRLTELLIGSGVVGYRNTNLTHLSVGTNRMLRKLDIRSCPNLRQPIDLSGCESIERIYAQGTGITSVILPPAGILTELHLPETVANLTVKNQPNLSDTLFTLAGVDHLTTFVYENSGGVNVFDIIERCFSLVAPVLSRVRMIGIEGNGASLATLYRLKRIGGLDENGNNTPVAVVTGIYHVEVASQVKLDEMKVAFPELEITYTQLDPPTVVTFVSSKGQTFTNPVFTCNFPYSKKSANVYHITAEDGEEVTYTLKSDNHAECSGSFVVTTSRSEQITAAYIPLRTINVTKYGTSTRIPSAQVKVGNQTYTTDANGSIQLRSGEAVAGQVTKTDYTSGTFSFAAIVSDTIHTFYLYPKVDVVFTVKNSEGGSLQGVIITCDGVSGTTNIDGQCTLKLSQLNLSFTATYGSAIQYNGIVNPLSIQTVNIAMTTNPYIYMPEKNGNIQMMLTGADGSVSVTSSTADYLIKWGDGVETAAEGTGAKTYTHTYGDTGYHQVEVANCANIRSCNGASACLAAYWSIGNSLVVINSFDGYRKLLCVGDDILKNGANLKQFSSGGHVGLFYDCISLLAVPYNLLYPCLNLEILESTFYNCRSLPAIPAGFLAYCSKVTNFNFFCYGCSLLSSIPDGFFDNCLKAKYFVYSFADCISLIYTPANYLDKCLEITTFNSVFRGCSSLPEAILPVTVNDLGAYTYYNCTFLQAIIVPHEAPPIIGTSIFGGTGCPIYVLDACVNDYKSATNWSAYASRIKPISQKL